ncbi:MAG: hypothetical protein HXS49_06240 [Theionarchaea archaeon]|nr:hypothetical protein [Theionarchaea archaeon]MBU7041072.1 hypothetical protein [Theionarchaea archaeon]
MARVRMGDSIAAILAMVGFILIEGDYSLAGVVLLAIAGVWIYKTQKVQLLVVYIGVVGLVFFLFFNEMIDVDMNLIAIFIPLILAWDSVTVYRTERRMKQVMKNLKVKNPQVEVIPSRVPSYYLRTYNLKSPYLVSVVCEEDVVRGYYDIKTNTWVTVESELFPVFSSVPEKVWKTVVSTHPDGSLHRVEHRDKFESVVRVDIYDELGTKTNASWRLCRDSYQTWDTTVREWKPCPRGWHPPQSVSGKVAALLGLS